MKNLVAAIFCTPLILAFATAQSSSCTASEATTVRLQTKAVSVRKLRNAVLFRAGMQIDADGAPNAYAPHNRGLVFPGSGLGQGKLRTPRDIRQSGTTLFRRWGGAARLHACFNKKLT